MNLLVIRFTLTQKLCDRFKNLLLNCIPKNHICWLIKKIFDLFYETSLNSQLFQNLIEIHKRYILVSNVVMKKLC